MKQIPITAHTPRDISDYNLSFAHGFVTERVLLWFFLLEALLIVVIILFSIIVKNQNILFLALAIFILLISFLSYSKIKKINQTIQNRKETFMHGIPIQATIIRHSRQMLYYKSQRDYVIHLQKQNTQQPVRIRSTKSWVFNTYPIGSQIIGLEYKKQQLFGPEINVQFNLK